MSDRLNEFYTGLMGMSNGKKHNPVPTETWQLYKAAREELGTAFMSKLYHRSKREVYRWSADPDFCEDTSRNPLDRLITLCRALFSAGRGDVVTNTLRMCADALGFEVNPRCSTSYHFGAVEQQVLSAYQSLTQFQAEITNENSDPKKSRYLADLAKREIEMTFNSRHGKACTIDPKLGAPGNVHSLKRAEGSDNDAHGPLNATHEVSPGK